MGGSCRRNAISAARAWKAQRKGKTIHFWCILSKSVLGVAIDLKSPLQAATHVAPHALTQAISERYPIILS